MRGLWRFGGERGFGGCSRSAVRRSGKKGWRKRVFAGGGKRRPLLSCIGAGVSAAAMRRNAVFSKKLNLGIDFCAKIVYTVHGKQNGDGFPPLSLTPIVSLD